jgi:hypothetical protein
MGEPMEEGGNREEKGEEAKPTLSDKIMREVLPDNFLHPPNLPKFLDYSNLHHHLDEYLAYASLHRLSNAMCCKLFLTTLSSTALSLFYTLPPKSIHNFRKLADNFVNNFA